MNAIGMCWGQAMSKAADVAVSAARRGAASTQWRIA